MNKVIKIIGWTCAFLFLLIPGVVITQFGYSNMLTWARLALYSNSWLIMAKGAIMALIYLVVDLVGCSIVIVTIWFAIFVVKEYILPKKNADNKKDQQKADKDGYAEV